LDSANFHAFLRSRRSVRRFKPEPISDAVIQRVLETAAYAPSAHNRQPWRYVVIRDAEQKAKFAEVMGDEFRQDLIADGLSRDEVEERVLRSCQRIESAPLAIVLCADFAEADEYPDPNRRAADSLMLVQDAALSGMQFLLAAHAEGLATVWMCAPLFAPETVRFALMLPNTWEPQALFLVGYADKVPELRERKKVEEYARFI
jgi:F420 biosynthesis protein FbiB-like protein